MFVRKRDPRYKAYIARQAQPSGQASPTPASGSVTPRKTALKSTFVAQDWQKVAETSDATADLEWARAEGAEDEEWECIACNKTFRSEAAWNSHERSKKHLRAVEQLKREMQDEEQELELGQSYDELTDADVKDDRSDNEVGQGTAGANATVDSSGDSDSPKATPDRGSSGTTPKEVENVKIEGKDFSSSPPDRQQQWTDKKANRPRKDAHAPHGVLLLVNKQVVTLNLPRRIHIMRGTKMMKYQRRTPAARQTPQKGSHYQNGRSAEPVRRRRKVAKVKPRASER